MLRFHLRSVRTIGLTRVSLLWLLTLLVAMASSLFILPEQYHQTIEQVDRSLSPSEVVRIRHSLGELGFSTKLVARVEIATGFLAFMTSAIIGWLLIHKRPHSGFAILLAFAFVAQAAAVYPPSIGELLPDRPVWAVIVRLFTMFGISMLFNMAFLFPDGRFVPRWTIVPAVFSVMGVVGLTWFPDSWLNSTNVPAVDAITTVVLLASILYSVVYRYRRVSTPEQQLQTRWVVLGLLVGLPGFLAGDAMMRNIGPDVGGVLCLFGFVFLMPLFNLAIPVSIGIAILHRRLFDIDVILNRTLVWGGMTGIILATYIGVVLGVGSVIHAQNSVLVSLLATGMVAILFQPVRDRLQRAVNRKLFGDRDDPYQALSRLNQRIEATISHHDLLPAIVRATADALRLPYVALHLTTNGIDERVAFSGTPGDGTLGFPIVYLGEPIGTLQVAPRSPDSQFSAADRRLLEDLARQVGIAAHTVRLTADLQRSRGQIVTAREEERRRLRRDLHDGLGSQLAGLSIQVGATRRLIVSDPARAQLEMEEIRHELRQAVADIRRLVQGLRPPALDELGIVQALTQRVKTFGEGGIESDGRGMRTHLYVTPDFPSIPAAVEVAIFRITEEALSNAARHALASLLTVKLHHDRDGILLHITDDGQGLPADLQRGLGMQTMRERAEELGGKFEVRSEAKGGVMIAVRLPVEWDRGVPA